MTANVGAMETRKRIVRKIKRMRDSGAYGKNFTFCADLIYFITTMDNRQNKRKGGLGRK